MTILVSSEDKSGKLADPTQVEGKIFLSFAGDSVIPSETLREKVLLYAVDKYNKLHPKNTVTLNADQVNAFKKTNMLGVPFHALPQVLSMETSKRDKFLGELTNPNVGIPINGNKDKNGALNEFQIWMWALANVAQDGRNDKIGQLDAEGKTAPKPSAMPISFIIQCSKAVPYPSRRIKTPLHDHSPRFRQPSDNGSQ